MTDTPRHIQQLQLQLWFQKSPGERLFQFLIDNDNMLKGIVEAKKELQKREKFKIQNSKVKSQKGKHSVR